MPLVLPQEVRDFARRGPDWAAFVERLPRLVRELSEEWSLVADGEPMHGYCALVLPVRQDGERAVLKLGFPDDESEHEAEALQRWGGHGAARLLAADPDRSALLLERLHPTDLTSVPIETACEVVARLYSSLHVVAPPRLRPLTEYVDRWTGRLARLPGDSPVPVRIVQRAVSLGRAFVTDPGSTGVLIHADLHYENVLAGDRAPWLVIDPKPVSGDPHYEPAPMLWNRWEEAMDSGDLVAEVQRRFRLLVEVAELDHARARDWVVVRMIHNAMWELEDAEAEQRSPDADYLALCVTIAQAVQD